MAGLFKRERDRPGRVIAVPIVSQEDAGHCSASLSRFI
jgi:hypothetical protein